MRVKDAQFALFAHAFYIYIDYNIEYNRERTRSYPHKKKKRGKTRQNKA